MTKKRTLPHGPRTPGPEPRIRWVAHGEKTKWSNFWIMINTNRAETEDTEKSFVVTTLRAAVTKVFGDRAMLDSVINIIDDDGNIVTDQETRLNELAKIEDIDTEAVVEIGKRQHRIHAHVLVMIQHHTRLQINVPALRDTIRELSIVDGVPMFINPAVKLRWIRENPINAIKKYQRGYKGLPGGLIDRVNQTH